MPTNKNPKEPPKPEEPKDPSDPERRDPNRQEPYDNPEEHLEIERRRFRGGLPPTPELYALAREQWNRLPGSLVRPPMDPVIGESGADDEQPTGQGQTDEERGES